MADEAAGLQVFLAVEAPALGLEVFLQLVEPLAPGIRAQHQEKVVATDMADEVAAGIDPLVQALRQAQQHLVAAGIAVQVDSAKYMNCCMAMPTGFSGYAKRIYKNDAVQVVELDVQNAYMGIFTLVWLFAVSEEEVQAGSGGLVSARNGQKRTFKFAYESRGANGYRHPAKATLNRHQALSLAISARTS